MSCSSSAKIQSFDKSLSEIPLFYSQAKPHTFRTYTADDPELYLGDDSDASYEQALMQAGSLFNTPSLFQPMIPNRRLEMLLRHFE